MSVKLYKLVFFVPEENCEFVKSEVFKTGAGTIGEYRNCSFQVLGTGQFCASQKASPTIGQADKLEVVKEYRVEILCSGNVIRLAIKALIDAHPYEEPAWEVYEVLNTTLKD